LASSSVLKKKSFYDSDACSCRYYQTFSFGSEPTAK